MTVRFGVFFLIYILTFACFAQDLDCQIFLNNKMTLKNKVTTKLNEKVSIGKSDLITGYITEKENHLYTIEAFLADYEVRIYGQGVLNNKDETLTASLWGRESMVDVSCRVLE